MDSLIEQALASTDPAVLRLALQLAQHPLTLFKPRPDRPEQLDEQASFYADRFGGLACVLAGNGAGKSWTASARVARFVTETPPPEPNTLFWVVNKNMDQATSNCWGQNLGKFIRPDWVESIYWHNEKMGRPRAVKLKPHANGHNYLIEFKSYDQGREALQSANIAGFWCDEQCPFEILTEIWARTRKWDFAGSKFYTLTPLEPDPKLEEIFHERDKYPSWKFYRFNTRLNDTLDPKYVRQITENELPELIETRLTGAFAVYEGQIYKTFSTKTHVVEPFPIPRTWKHVRGLDLGWSHATACVWLANDPAADRWYVYREYLKSKTSLEDHVAEINDDWLTKEVRGPTYADPAAAQELHEMSKRGLHTALAAKDVKKGIATVQSLLRPAEDGQPKLYIFNNCENLIREMRTYIWNPKKPDAPLKAGDDLVDALRYALFSHLVQTPTKETTVLGPKLERKLPF